jgi:tRNA (guanine37-N1)-methyltransferase
MTVPDVLLSGHHAEIAAWRKSQALARTEARRGDLLAEKKQVGSSILKENKI